MIYKPATAAQTEGLRDSLKADAATGYIPLSDARIAELTTLATKVGARIHILRRVRVQQDRDWQVAINLAGPNTPFDYKVRKSKVSMRYPPISKAVVEKDIVLLNYSKGDSNWDKVTAWGNEAKVKATNPREVFAIGEQHPTLHSTLGQNSMYVVTLTGGSRRACCVWWSVSRREADLYWVCFFDRSDIWFAFCE